LEKTNHNKKSFEQAWKRALEFDYDIPHSEKIPTGIFYQEEKPVFEDLYPQLVELKKKKMSWKDIRR